VENNVSHKNSVLNNKPTAKNISFGITKQNIGLRKTPRHLIGKNYA
jgi:hypothetical protein